MHCPVLQDELGEAYPNQRGLSQLASGLIKIGGRSVDGRTTSGGGVAADDATADTAAASARKLVAGGVHLLLSFGGGPQIQNQQQGPQQQGLPDQQQGQPQLQRLQVPADGPAQPLAAGPAARRGDCSAHELPQQQDQGSAAEPGPAGADIGGRGEVREGAALTRALEDSAAGVASNGAATRHGVNAGGQCAAGSSSSAAGAGAAVASAAATAADSTAAAAAAAAVADAAPQAGCMRVKPCDRIPSPDEVLAELGALVKEHRTNVNEAPFTLEAVLGHGSFGTVYKGKAEPAGGAELAWAGGGVGAELAGGKYIITAAPACMHCPSQALMDFALALCSRHCTASRPFASTTRYGMHDRNVR